MQTCIYIGVPEEAFKPTTHTDQEYLHFKNLYYAPTTSTASSDFHSPKMPLASDITLDSSKFHPENINDEAKNANAFIMSTREKSVSWHGIEPKIYREMVEDGKTMFPVPTYLPEAKDATLPSRDAGRDIPLRVYRPDNGEKSKGVLLHIHGGGFVLATHKQ